LKGGCGRNVDSKENITNIKQYEYSREVYVQSGNTVRFSFSTLGIVEEAGFTSKTSEGCLGARAEILKGRPALATSDAPGSIYINVWVGPWGYSDSDRIADSYVIFTIPETIDDESIGFMMYKDGSWTDQKYERMEGKRYKVHTRGFGNFAIVKVRRTSEGGMNTDAQIPASSGITDKSTRWPAKNWALILVVFGITAVIAAIYLIAKGRFRIK
jgi:PGF-pre-PGF domain-containing protein